MITHMILFMVLMVLAIIDCTLWYKTLDYIEIEDYQKACRYDKALRWSWFLTNLTNIGILSLQVYMSVKFSAPASRYKNKFMLVYQSNMRRL